MKVKFKVEQLKSALSKLSKAVPKSHQIHSLTHVLFEIENDVAVIKGNDLSIQIAISIPCDIDEETAEFAIPFTKMFSLVKTLPDDKSVTINVNEKAVISCGKSKSTMPLCPVSSFPAVVTGDKEELSVVATELAEAIGMVHFAAARADAARKMLNGVALIGNDKGIDVVATNSAIIAIKSIECEKQELSIIIPIKSVSVVRESLAEATKVEVDDNNLIITGSDFEVVVSLIDMQYVNYKVAIPSADVKHELKFSREGMLECLNRISVIADDPFKSRCIINAKVGSGEAIIQGRFLAGDTNEIDESITMENKSDSDMKIAYNPFYLSQALSKLDSDMVTCKVYNNRISPIVIEESGFTSVITQVLI